MFLTKIEDKWVYGLGYLMGEFDEDLGWEKGVFINEFKALIKEDIFVKHPDKRTCSQLNYKIT